MSHSGLVPPTLSILMVMMVVMVMVMIMVMMMMVMMLVMMGMEMMLMIVEKNIAPQSLTRLVSPTLSVMTPLVWSMMGILVI